MKPEIIILAAALSAGCATPHTSTRPLQKPITAAAEDLSWNYEDQLLIFSAENYAFERRGEPSFYLQPHAKEVIKPGHPAFDDYLSRFPSLRKEDVASIVLLLRENDHGRIRVLVVFDKKENAIGYAEETEGDPDLDKNEKLQDI